MIADLPDIVDERIALDQQADKLVVIILVGAIDLGGDFQRNTAACRDPDRAIDAFLRIQFACGTGRRCALETETTGTSEKVWNTG